jgi:gamma-carbonic anhydrase
MTPMPSTGLIMPYRGVMPRIAASAFIAPGAVVAGEVEIGEGCSIWFQCVLRGDVNRIIVGDRVNLQDGTIVHVSRRGHGEAIIGDDVSVGHKAIIHSCVLEPRAFVGMGATVMDGCVVEGDGMVAAGALLTPNKRVKTGELWGGSPAKFMRALTPDEIARNRDTARHYSAMGGEYRATLLGGTAPGAASNERLSA